MFLIAKKQVNSTQSVHIDNMVPVDHLLQGKINIDDFLSNIINTILISYANSLNGVSGFNKKVYIRDIGRCELVLQLWDVCDTISIDGYYKSSTKDICYHIVGCYGENNLDDRYKDYEIIKYVRDYEFLDIPPFMLNTSFFKLYDSKFINLLPAYFDGRPMISNDSNFVKEFIDFSIKYKFIDEVNLNLYKTSLDISNNLLNQIIN